MVTVSEDRQGVQGFDLGAEILRAMMDYDKPISLSELARICDMAPSKVSRYLVSLLRCGLVEINQTTNRYRLGRFALQLGLAAVRGMDLSALAEPILQNLCLQTQQTVALSVWGNQGPVIIRCVEAGDLVTVHLRLGAELPLCESATGQCFAAFSNSIKVKRTLDECIRNFASEQQISTGIARNTIHSRLYESRKYGLAKTADSLVVGFSGFSAPVFDHSGGMIAAITVLGSIGNDKLNYSSSLADNIRSAATLLSAELGASEHTKQQLPNLANISKLTNREIE